MGTAAQSMKRGFVPGLKQIALGIVLGAAFGLVAMEAQDRYGSIMFAGLVVIGLVGLVLLARPGVTFVVFATATVLLEEDKAGFLPATAAFYDGVYRTLSPFDLLFITLTLAVLIGLGREGRRPALPDPFTFPLLLLGCGAAVGIVVGYSAGARLQDILYPARTIAYVILTPFLLLQVLDSRRKVRMVVYGAIALAGWKGIEGTLAYVSGRGRAIEGTTLTYYAPAAPWLLVLFLLGVLAAVLVGYRLPWWMLPISTFAFLALLFSFRRSFWVALILGAIIVLVLARGERRFRVLVPAVLVFGVVFAAGLASFGSLGGVSVPAPVLERARELNPNSFNVSGNDRYRIAERRNVINDLRHHAVLGRGLAVPWHASKPIRGTFEGSRTYVHMALLNHWLKFGILGVIAYVWLMGSIVFAAYRSWRRADEALFRIGALALLGATIGLATADLTASLSNSNVRLSFLVAIGIGWLAAVRRLERSDDDAPTVAPREAAAARAA